MEKAWNKETACISMDLVDRLGDLARGSSDLAQALECVSVAVGSRSCDPDAYIEGTVAVLLFAAEHVHEQAESLYQTVEGARAG